MQVTRPEDMTEEKAEKLGKLRKEFFSKENKELLQKSMKDRMEFLSTHKREVLVSRTEIEPEAIPLVVANIALNIMMSHHRQERRRLKKELIKLIEKL